MSYFVTGGTGFIGRYVLERLLERKGRIYVLVRPQSKERMDAVIERLGAPKGRIVQVTGDITEPHLGLSQADRERIKGVDHFLHLGAVYDITAGEQINRETNVGGTINAVRLANSLDHATFHHISTIAVAGRYNGVFREDMFDAGQKLEFPYDRTKFEAEQIVREELTIPKRIYRLAIVVGDSQTGAIDKIDGPYLLFKWLKRASDRLPAWLPTFGITGGQVNMVPVDFAAGAIDFLMHKEGLDERTFHLADPYPPTVGEAITIFANAGGAPGFNIRTSNAIDFLMHKEGLDERTFHLADPYPPTVGEAVTIFANAGGAPGFNIRTSNAIAQSAPRVLLGLAQHSPPTKMITDELVKQLDLPRQFWDNLDNPTRFDCSETLKELDGSGLFVPPLERYAKTLWDYWERNFSDAATENRKLKRSVNGKVVVITGASSGIGEVVAHRVGRAGATVILVARTQSKLDVIRDEIIDAGGDADVFTADLADLKDCERVIEDIIEKHGRVDVLVNNAGRSIRRSLTSSADRFHDFERTMQLNYFGALRMIMSVLPGMRQRKYGRIINISSIGAQAYPPRFSAYVASKSALDAFSRCAQPEVLSDGVIFTTVYMPLVKTPMTAPTTIYKAFPMITPHEASDLVIKGMVGTPRKVTTNLGRTGEVLHALSPELADRILATAYNLFPESAAAKGTAGSRDQITPEAIAFAHVMRGVYW